MTDPTPAATARDALEPHDIGCRCWPHVSQRDATAAVERVALLEYRSHPAAEATGRVAALEAALRSITRRERRVPAHRGWYIDHSMDLMHDEGEPCVICDALAAAEAPGRVAALEAALRAIAVREPAPAIPGCTCDPDSATDDDGNLVMCDLHEPMLRHLRWETLASLVIDYQAFMRHALAVADAALAAPAPTPSEPVERVRAEYEAWLDEAIAKAKRWRDAGTLTESEYAAAMAVLFVTDAKPTDEEMERIRAMCIERGWTAAPAPTPSDGCPAWKEQP